MNLRIEYRAAMKAERLGIPFALVVKPGEKTPLFFVENPNKSQGCRLLVGSDFDTFNGFVFNSFELNDKLCAIGIRSELTAKDLLDMDESIIPRQRDCLAPHNEVTTDYMVYRAQALSIINSFDDQNQKTVLSHIVSLHTVSNPVEACCKYFSKHNDCFRYIYYTPQSGIWMGASPELLIDYDEASEQLQSMSLAGTIFDENEKEWDEKNTLEHNMVTDHIVSVFSRAGLSDISTRKVDLKFGEIRHMCHHISAHGKIIASELLPKLSPTPALCGWPRERAYRQIVDTEAHIRGCYGGFVGVKNSHSMTIYVNLRCAKITPRFIPEIRTRMYDYTLFGGGGLTIHSDPDKEWHEAKSKINSLISIL